MKYKELVDELNRISDSKFADFSKSLLNSDYKVIGVKSPVLRDLVKKYKNDEELKTSDFKIGEYFEIDLLYFALSLVRLNDIDKQLSFLKKNIKYAKSWAITDSMSAYMKKISFEQFYEFFLSTYNSKYTYERRMAYVLGLKQYRENRITDILPFIVHNEEYMVMMSEAWLLSVIALKHEDAVYEYLKECDDLVLKRKTISKICDSFRYSNESKEKFKELRK